MGDRPSIGIRTDTNDMEATATGFNAGDYSSAVRGNNSQAIYEYDDISIGELQTGLGQTFTVSGNFANFPGGDGYGGNSAEYELIESLGFGTFTLDDDFEDNGEWSFTFAAEDILNNSNWTTTGEFVFEFQISGYGSSVNERPSAPNTDTIRVTIACFAQGTLIATPDGECPVETLQIGDLIKTADGRIVSVKWIGRQTLVKQFMGERAQLVRIKAGTLDNHSDLYVTGDHGMLVEGYIINASALVNGTTIDWVPLSETPDRQTVYHVEIDQHDVILANGALTESYLDIPGRDAFDNHRDYLAIYGCTHPIAESGLLRISTARLVPAYINEMTNPPRDCA